MSYNLIYLGIMTQNTVRMWEGNNLLLKIEFQTQDCCRSKKEVPQIKLPILLQTFTPISELPSNTSTMVQACAFS